MKQIWKARRFQCFQRRIWRSLRTICELNLNPCMVGRVVSWLYLYRMLDWCGFTSASLQYWDSRDKNHEASPFLECATSCAGNPVTEWLWQVYDFLVKSPLANEIKQFLYLPGEAGQIGTSLWHHFQSSKVTQPWRVFLGSSWSRGCSYCCTESPPKTQQSMGAQQHGHDENWRNLCARFLQMSSLMRCFCVGFVDWQTGFTKFCFFVVICWTLPVKHIRVRQQTANLIFSCRLNLIHISAFFSPHGPGDPKICKSYSCIVLHVLEYISKSIRN